MKLSEYIERKQFQSLKIEAAAAENRRRIVRGENPNASVSHLYITSSDGKRCRIWDPKFGTSPLPDSVSDRVFQPNKRLKRKSRAFSVVEI